MTRRWILLVLAALTLAPAAQAAADCAVARDPLRCQAREAAEAACADARGAERRACVEASLPPADCTKARERKRCERENRVRATCRAAGGKALAKCLRDEEAKERARDRPERRGSSARRGDG